MLAHPPNGVSADDDVDIGQSPHADREWVAPQCPVGLFEVHFFERQEDRRAQQVERRHKREREPRVMDVDKQAGILAIVAKRARNAQIARRDHRDLELAGDRDRWRLATIARRDQPPHAGVRPQRKPEDEQDQRGGNREGHNVPYGPECFSQLGPFMLVQPGNPPAR